MIVVRECPEPKPVCVPAYSPKFCSQAGLASFRGFGCVSE